MNAMKTINLIDELHAAVEDQVSLLRKWAELPLELLISRPTPQAWSMLEVIEHLNINSGHYTKRLKWIYAKEEALAMDTEFSPGKWGEKLTVSMKPSPDGLIPKPMRTLWVFEPKAAGAKGKESVREFQRMLDDQLSLLEQARTMGWEGPRVTSTLGPILRFKIGDAFRFMIAHQERHFLQAARALVQLEAAQASVLSVR